MPDLHDFLDDEARRVRSEPGALGQVLDQANRRRRTKRIATGALALAVAAGGIGLAFAAFRPSRSIHPATGPAPGPSESPTPVSDLGVVLVGDRSSIEGAGEFARALLLGEGIRAEPMLLRAGDRNNEITTIHFHPSREADVLELRDRYFPEAELRPRTRADTVLVAVGNDFVQNHEEGFELFMLIRSFMTRRVEGLGAEPFLAEAAARQYANGLLGLSLYEYSEHGTFFISRIEPVSDRALTAEAIIVTPAGRDAVVIERISAGSTGPEDVPPQILSAEIRGPGPPYQEIQAFVNDFLDARRTASGAGTYLGEDAREAFAAHEGRLDLLRYAADPDLVEARIVKYDRSSNERHLVVVRFTVERRDGGWVRAFEALTIEAHDGGFVVADAERVSLDEISKG